MRAAGEEAGALQESEPNPCNAWRTCGGGGPPLTQVVCAEMTEAEASRTFNEACGLKEGRRARNGCQAGTASHLGQSQLQYTMEQEAGEAACTRPPNGDCTYGGRGREPIFT